MPIRRTNTGAVLLHFVHTNHTQTRTHTHTRGDRAFLVHPAQARERERVECRGMRRGCARLQWPRKCEFTRTQFDKISSHHHSRASYMNERRSPLAHTHQRDQRFSNRKRVPRSPGLAIVITITSQSRCCWWWWQWLRWL